MASKRGTPLTATFIVAAGVVGLASFLALKFLDKSNDGNEKKETTREIKKSKAKPEQKLSPKAAAVVIENAFVAHKDNDKASPTAKTEPVKTKTPPPSPKRTQSPIVEAKKIPTPVASPIARKKSLPVEVPEKTTTETEPAIAHEPTPSCASPAATPKQITPVSSPKKSTPIASPVQAMRKNSVSKDVPPPPPSPKAIEAASVIENAYIAHKSSPKASPKTTPVASPVSSPKTTPVSSPKKSTPVASPKKPTPVSSPVQTTRKNSIPDVQVAKEAEAVGVIENAYLLHKSSPKQSPASSPKKSTPVASPKEGVTPVSSPKKIARKGSLPPEVHTEAPPSPKDIEAARVIESAFIVHKEASSPKRESTLLIDTTEEKPLQSSVTSDGFVEVHEAETIPEEAKEAVPNASPTTEQTKKNKKKKKKGKK